MIKCSNPNATQLLVTKQQTEKGKHSTVHTVLRCDYKEG